MKKQNAAHVETSEAFDQALVPHDYQTQMERLKKRILTRKKIDTSESLIFCVLKIEKMSMDLRYHYKFQNILNIL